MRYLYATRKILAAVAVVIITGCASSNIQKTATFDSQSNQGLVLGSISHSDDRSRYKVFYSGLDNSAEGRIQSGDRGLFLRNWPSGDLDTAGLRGDLFAVKLPAGDYEFYSWNVSNKDKQVYPVESFSLKFSVAPGVANYLGNFHFGTKSSDDSAIAGIDVSYSDEYARDIALLQRKYENVDFQGTARGVEADLEMGSLGGALATELAMSVYVFSSF
ncbi:MAG: hypothetical protein ACR2P1_02605 [Pseudomonadales bacterium]